MIFLILSILFSGTAKIAFVHHGNQHFGDNGSYALLPGQPGYVGNSYHRTLDTHFYWDVPIDIHISGTLAQSYKWLQNDNGLLQRLRNSSLVDILGGVYGQLIMPYISLEIVQKSLDYHKKLMREIVKEPGWPDFPTVVWIPERVYKSDLLMPYSLVGVLNSVYGKVGRTSWGQNVYMPPCVILDDNVHSWYYHTFPDGTPCNNPHKVHRVYDRQGNYVFVVFISSTARHQMVWNDVSQPWNPLRNLLESLRDHWDQAQIVIYGDDWEKASGVAGWDFGHPSAPANSYDHNISWIKSQNWIQPVHVCEAVKWWGVDFLYDSNPYNDPPAIVIDYAAYQELHEWTGGTYDNWYNNFKISQAFECGLSSDYNNNNIRGDYEDLWLGSWISLNNAPNNRFKELGYITTASLLYETAWHTGPGGSLVYWGKNLWNHTRYGKIFAFGSLWLDSLRNLVGPHARVGDFDGDGIQEIAIWNEKICLVFDRRGGRALALFTKDTSVIIGNLLSNWGREGDWDDGGHPGLFHDTQGWNSWFNFSMDSTRQDTLKLTLQEAYDQYGSPNSDLRKEVILIRNKSYVQILIYSLFHNWTKSGLTPDLYEVYTRGLNPQIVYGMSPNGWAYAGFRGPNGSYGVYVWGHNNNLRFNYLGRLWSGAELVELGGRNGLYGFFFYAGKEPPEIDMIGPGDLEGPMIFSTQHFPQDYVLPTDTVLITTRVFDPSGVLYVQVHYGVNGNWSYPPLTLFEDNGTNYDWNRDGTPTPGLYGNFMPHFPYGSRVEYVVHARDIYQNTSWDNNYGRNYSYTVGLVRFFMDGHLDRVAQLVATHGDMKLWAYLYHDSGYLYVATQASGDANDYFNNDHFILITFGNPTPMRNAPWAKSGQVGRFHFFLADENDNSFSGWFDSLQNLILDTTKFLWASGANESQNVLEGVIKIKNIFGRIPDTIMVCALSYQTWDGGSLVWQVPRPVYQNGNVEPEEFYPLRRITNYILDGYPDSISILVDSSMGQRLYYHFDQLNYRLYLAFNSENSAFGRKLLFLNFDFPWNSHYDFYIMDIPTSLTFHDSLNNPIQDTSKARLYKPTGLGFSEAVINLRNLLGNIPIQFGLYFALGIYQGTTMITQLPKTLDGNNQIDEYEWFVRRVRLVRGDTDANGVRNRKDLIYYSKILYWGYPIIPPYLVNDVNNDGLVDDKDLTFFSRYLYLGGPEPQK